jgi:hypothetical protein
MKTNQVSSGKRHIVPAAVLALSAIAVLSPANAELLDTPWSGAGTGTTATVSDGSAPPAEFSYAAQSFFGGWNFQTVAASARTVLLKYRYTGFHAWFQVTVGLDAVFGGQVYPLVNDGPVNCCTYPSGGFDYAGTVALPVLAGDSYGFAMRGSNFDSDDRLIGTLVVDELGKEDCKAGGWKALHDLSGAPLFKNQGDCVSFVATEGRNDPGRNFP